MRVLRTGPLPGPQQAGVPAAFPHSTMAPSDSVRALLAAHTQATPVRWRDIVPASLAEAYAVQDALLAQLGPVGGWKVGAAGPQAEPGCAPLPAAFDAVLPVIEVVESRLLDRVGSDPLAQVADLQNHGALVLGAPCALPPALLDLRTLEVSLAFDGQPVAQTRGGNPAADVWRLVAWLVRHCAQRGQPLRAGQIVTTGSCTGMLPAPAGALVQAQVAGIGAISVQF